jgi:asparagine synthase (glutamine-hydrolysing)
VQLSGGLDSANTALSMAATGAGPGVTAAALILGGEQGTQQARRRATMLEHLGRWPDLTVPVMDHLPYHPGSCFARQVPVSPYGDLYLDAVDTLHGLLQDHGVRVLFTGIGGDELMAYTEAEAPDRTAPMDGGLPAWTGPAARDLLEDLDGGIAPASVVPETALMAKAGVAAPIIKRGMWPLHPLTDPAVVRFCEWLPVEWRADKRLLRERLGRTGMPAEIARPPIPENFGNVMHTAMRQHGGRRVRLLLNDGSPLIDAKILDPAALAAVADRLDDGTSSRADREVVFALLADSALTMR